MRLLALLLAFLWTAAAAAQSPVPGSISKEEVRALSPEALTRRLFGETGRMLIPFHNGRHLASRDTLRRLGFLSVPTWDGVPGVCATQYLHLYFRTVTPDYSGMPSEMDSPSRRVLPHRLGMDVFYIIREPEASERNHPHLLPIACPSVDPRQARRIVTDSPELIRSTVLELRPVFEAISARRSMLPVTCAWNILHRSEAECRAALSELAAGRPERLDEVHACGSACLETRFGSILIRVHRWAGAPVRIELAWTPAPVAIEAD
jgi:hypothetical protein